MLSITPEILLSYQLEKYAALLQNATTTEARAFARAELHRLKKLKPE